jgi:alpha-amylase
MITQDDILYMIVTDRFANGDPSNNHRDVDRSDLNLRHGGDLLGIVDRMPYLNALGVTALWITPVYRNPIYAYHGYHPLDFESVDPHLCSPQLGPTGSPEVVRRFTEIAHNRGLKVMLDLIVTHTAPGHPWLTERPDWFNRGGDTIEKMWWAGLPSLNQDKIDVNLYFVQNVMDWINHSNADAVRIDAARHAEKQFWSVFKLFAHGFHPDITLVGEVWDHEVGHVAPYQTDYGFDSMFDYPLYHAIVDVFVQDHGFGRIARPELGDWEPQGILNQDLAYRNAYQLVTFLDNHDTPRFFHLAGGEGRPAEAMARTKLALTFLLTTRGIPQLYYGAELAMEGGEHPDNRRDMPWELVEQTGLDTPAARRAREMLSFTRHLIHLRRESMALRYGLLITLYVTPTLYAFTRTYLDETRVVVLNNSWEKVDIPIPLYKNPRLPTLAREHLPDGMVLTNSLNPSDRVRIDNGHIRVCLPGKSAAVYGSGKPAVTGASVDSLMTACAR